MYSKLFEFDTTGPDGLATALDLDIAPGTLTTLIPHDYASVELPIARLKQIQAEGELVVESRS
jgi:hypothetical protein